MLAEATPLVQVEHDVESCFVEGQLLQRRGSPRVCHARVASAALAIAIGAILLMRTSAGAPLFGEASPKGLQATASVDDVLGQAQDRDHSLGSQANAMLAGVENADKGENLLSGFMGGFGASKTSGGKGQFGFLDDAIAEDREHEEERSQRRGRSLAAGKVVVLGRTHNGDKVKGEQHEHTNEGNGFMIGEVVSKQPDSPGYVLAGVPAGTGP